MSIKNTKGLESLEGNQLKDNDLLIFENLIVSENERFASRKQIKNIYRVPRKTLSYSINQLKKDGLISGAKIRLTARDGKIYPTEVFSLQETIKIGFRLRSDIALNLQDIASTLMVKRLNEIVKENRLLELELSYAWNKSDQNDLYR